MVPRDDDVSVTFPSGASRAVGEHLEIVSDLKKQETTIELQLGRLINEARCLRREVETRNECIAELQRQIEGYRNSTCWQITAPLRWISRVLKMGMAQAVRLPKRPRQLWRVTKFARAKVRELGIIETARQAARLLRRYSLRELMARAAQHSGTLQPGRSLIHDPPSLPAPATLAPRVLIVAELRIPPCSKYRVWQKKEHFERLGVPCTVVNWSLTQDVHTLLQTHSAVIFYRVPGFPEMLGFVEEARRLGMPSFWEVDDLIFDPDAYDSKHNLDLGMKEVRQSVIGSVPIFRAALCACDYGLASTAMLAHCMQKAGVRRTFVVENACDAETLHQAERLQSRSRPHRAPGEVVIMYGSGTNTHNIDFLEAADALLEVMRRRPGVRFRVVGDLQLPASFDQVADRVERRLRLDFPAYLECLWEADISIAPLESMIFNDTKSNIKFLEAAVLGIPSVCSPRATFRDAIEDGVTGFLADGVVQWVERLLTLCDDAALRQVMGARARTAALARYAPDAIVRQQVAPILDFLGRQRRSTLNVLTANVFFQPQSSGGAPTVAEDLARRLNARDDTQVAVFTSLGAEHDPYSLLRYEADGLSVLAVRIPPISDGTLEHWNEHMADRFADALAAYRPDVVHLQSLQEISAPIAKACMAAGIPYVVTVADIELTIRRRDDVRRVLDGARLLLTPSEFHRQRHIASGIDPARIRVNRNGVHMPGPDFRRTDSRVLRIGFNGGIGQTNEMDHIRRAFLDIDRGDYELTLFNNTRKMGYSFVRAEDWSIPGVVRIHPAYAQADLDAIFGSMDVLLFPSQSKESVDLTVCEALARHVWVISTDAGGAGEYIIDGVNGTIIPMGPDHGPLRNAIVNLLENQSQFARYRNPYADRITTYDMHTAELRQILAEVAARDTHPAMRAA